MAKETKSTTKLKKKKWVSIQAPEVLNKQEIGQSYVRDVNSLKGKKAHINLMGVTQNPKQRKYNTSLVITDIENDTANTAIKSYGMQASAIKMLSRKGNTKIEHCFNAKTSDDKEVKIKPILITKAHVPHSLQTKLRKAFEESMKNYLQKTDSNRLFSDLYSHKIVKSIKKELDKTYPLKLIEFREVSLQS